MTSIDNWSDIEAERAIKKYKKLGFSKDLSLRTYSARLLGQDPELVLHGGGNTSVKSVSKNLIGEEIPVLYIKGSGWDLGKIEPLGHPAVKLEPLLKLKNLKTLTDEEMVAVQRQNLIDPNSPNPSVEALLHAFLPHKFVDHTHSISILAIADQPDAEKLFKRYFGKKISIVPYVMPGFQLALESNKAFIRDQKIALEEGTELEGMVLIKHGLFTFGNSAKESYQRMINIVNQAEGLLPKSIELKLDNSHNSRDNNSLKVIPYLRGLLSRESRKHNGNKKWIFEIRSNQKIIDFVNQDNIIELAKRGVATPDHVIRTKSHPLVLDQFFCDENGFNNIEDWMLSTNKKLKNYIDEYTDYFKRNNKRFKNCKKMLDPIPRLILIPNLGLISIGENKKAAKITADIGQAWIETVKASECLGKFNPVNESETFDLEYWSLEQAKIGKSREPVLSGNIVAITGAGGVIGREIAKEFSKAGAETICIDIDYEEARETARVCGEHSIAIKCDLTNKEDLEKTFKSIVSNFGGLDIMISNAGSAWEGNISELKDNVLQKSLEINLFAHQNIAKHSVRLFKSQDYMEKDYENSLGGHLLFNISKQALNPGKGFGAYGIAKASLLALMKQYSLEEGSNKIKSNGINADRIRSNLLSNNMIKSRSKARGLTEDEYMSGNLLKIEVKPIDVAKAFLSLALMEKTTGALLTVDGGNTAAMVR